MINMEYDYYDPLPAYSSKMKYKTKNNSYRSVFANHASPKDGDFKCMHCRHHVVQTPFLSGVQNRNHCPYCLWSKHVDLHQSGDRLAACKSNMRPVGLALKKSRKKYRAENAGELMLIHQCEGCGKVSINRIAADDLTDRLYDIFLDSFELDGEPCSQMEETGIQPLGVADTQVVKARLFGVKEGILG
jgi:hypothetical protein